MAEDEYTLRPGDPCGPTLEAYKQYLTPLVDDYWQVNEYETYAPDLSRWQQCCPGSAAVVARLRPDKAILPSLDDIPLPAIFGKEAPCARAIHNQGLFTLSGTGNFWLHDYSGKRQVYWGGQYASVRDQLHGCCVDNFNACLKKAGRPDAPGDASAAASSECLRRFSPDHQQLVTATPAEAARAACAAELKQLRSQDAQAVTELRQAEAVQRQEDARLCEQRLQAPKQAAEQQAAVASARGQEIDRTRASLRSCEAATAQAMTERDHLQAALAKIVIRPGSEVLAGFPAGTGSLELALCGAAVLLTGFLLGRSGRHARWTKLISGTVAALISLCIYLGVVYLLPDTRPTDLLLALAGALLFASLGELLHFSPFSRQGRTLNRRTDWRPPPLPPEPPAAFPPPAAPAPAGPGRRIRRRPPPPAEPAAPAAPEAPVPPARRENDDEAVADGYSLVPFDERDRQHPLFRCQGCERIYRETSLPELFRRTGGACWCGSRDFREYQLPP